MQAPIKVLVVDDAALYRTALTMALNRDPGIQVVGTAPNGRVALSRIEQLKPDLVTLDFEMPEMDGLQTLRQMRTQFPGVRAIMASAHTRRGAELTLDALAAGATDFIEKPSGAGTEQVLQEVAAQLIPMIKGICGRAGGAEPAAAASRQRTSNLVRLTMPKQLLVVGVSTGGPNALAEVIPRLPAGLPVPVAVVQHMPALFTAQLADRLAAKSQVPVKEAAEGELLKAGQVYIAPGDWHLRVKRQGTGFVAALDQGAKLNSCRPAADALFESAVEACGHRVLACVMTGMGNDGCKGAAAVRKAGGAVLAQSRETCVVWGMPRAVEEAGLADEVLPLTELAAAMVRYAPKG